MNWVNTSPLAKTYTLNEFWALPEPPDYSKVELIAGVLYLTPRPDVSHGNVVSSLLRIMTEHCLGTSDKGRLCVPRTGICGKDTWLEPDFFYVSADTEARLNGEYHSTADLVVEVISAESAVYDRNTKSDTYAALEVKELWLVDLSGIIEIRVLNNSVYQSDVFARDQRIGSTVLRGLEFGAGDVFDD